MVTIDSKLAARIQAQMGPDAAQVLLAVADKLRNEGKDPTSASLANGLAEVMSATAELQGPTFLAKLDAAAATELERRRRAAKDVRRAIRKSWGAALTDLELLIEACIAARARYWTDFADGALRAQVRAATIAKLHARGCELANEVTCLLRSGYSAAALARWHSLHETAVVAAFLFHREEAVAQAYLDHASLESPFGWAADTLGKNSPTLRDLEAVGFARFPPHLRLAHQPAAPHQKICPYTIEDARNDLKPPGPSDANLANPGEQVAESLLLLSISLLTIKPTIHLSSVLGGLTELTIRTIDKFGEARREHEQR